MSRAVPVRYTNYRGETRIRMVIPENIRWGSTKWHPQPQYLISCIDTQKGKRRELALMDCDFNVNEEPTDANP